MEKRKPHCPLTQVKMLIGEGKVRISATAVLTGGALGFNREGIIEVVMSLTQVDFYKSMTTYNDHHIWQDVYHPLTDAGEVYVKLSIVQDVLVVSFKEI